MDEDDYDWSTVKILTDEESQKILTRQQEYRMAETERGMQERAMPQGNIPEATTAGAINSYLGNVPEWALQQISSNNPITQLKRENPGSWMAGEMIGPALPAHRSIKAIQNLKYMTPFARNLLRTGFASDFDPWALGITGAFHGASELIPTINKESLLNMRNSLAAKILGQRANTDIADTPEKIQKLGKIGFERGYVDMPVGKRYDRIMGELEKSGSKIKNITSEIDAIEKFTKKPLGFTPSDINKRIGSPTKEGELFSLEAGTLGLNRKTPDFEAFRLTSKGKDFFNEYYKPQTEALKKETMTELRFMPIRKKYTGNPDGDPRNFVYPSDYYKLLPPGKGYKPQEMKIIIEKNMNKPLPFESSERLKKEAYDLAYDYGRPDAARSLAKKMGNIYKTETEKAIESMATNPQIQSQLSKNPITGNPNILEYKDINQKMSELMDLKELSNAVITLGNRGMRTTATQKGAALSGNIGPLSYSLLGQATPYLGMHGANVLSKAYNPNFIEPASRVLKKGVPSAFFGLLGE